MIWSLNYSSNIIVYEYPRANLTDCKNLGNRNSVLMETTVSCSENFLIKFHYNVFIRQWYNLIFPLENTYNLSKQIDYILMLVKKYHDAHCEDKEVLFTIKKAIDTSPELRSKKQLIETFIAGINDADDIMSEWHDYVVRQREEEPQTIITEEKLKPEDTTSSLKMHFVTVKSKLPVQILTKLCHLCPDSVTVAELRKSKMSLIN